MTTPNVSEDQLPPLDGAPYTVEPDGKGCDCCGYGQLWWIVFGPEDIAESTGYEDKEEAEDICEDLNRAFAKGQADALRELQQLRQRLSEVEGERWIPVQEAMPPDTKTVLVWCPERKNTYSANWVVPFWCHFADNGNRKVEQVITHWRPLPAPPKVKP